MLTPALNSPMLSPELVSTLALAWSQAMVSATAKGLVLLGLAMLATWMLRRRAAAARHLVWTLAIGGLLSLPLLTQVVPAWEVPALPRLDVSLQAAGSGRTFGENEGQRAGRSTRMLRPGRPMAAASGDGGEAPTTVLFRRDADAGTLAEAWHSVGTLPPQRTDSPTTTSDRTAVTLSTFLSRAAEAAARWHPSVWLLLFWELGAMAVAGRFALGFSRLRALHRRSAPVDDPAWLDLLDQLSARTGLDPAPRLVWSEESLTPMTWGIRRPIILLPREADQWSASRRNDVLLHELAHVQRRDILTQLLAQAACVVFWFHPLPWFAAGRMRLERERACDDRVLMAGSRASTYAGHLLEMARSLRSEPTLAAATVAMARRSQLGERMESLLDHRARGRVLGRMTQAVLVLASASVLLPLASLAPGQEATHVAHAAPPDHVLERQAQRVPAVAPRSGWAVVPRVPSVHLSPRAPVAPTAPSPTRVHATAPLAWVAGGDHQAVLASGQMWRGHLGSSEDDYEVEWERGSFTFRDHDHELRVEIDGNVRFRADESDVEWMDDRARFELDEEQGRDRRRLEIEVGRDGELERRYFEDRRQSEYDAEAQAWFARALQDFLLRAGIGMEPRLQRWIEADGVSGTLERIDGLEGDFLRARYWSSFFALESLSDGERREVARNFPRNLDSDFEKASLLIGAHDAFLGDEELRDVYLEVAGTLDSDFERARVLQTIPAGALDDPDFQTRYVDVMAGLDSDFERARTLIALADGHELAGDVVPVIAALVRDMGSDFEKARVLEVFADAAMGDPQAREAVLESVAGIHSDFEKAGVLMAILGRGAPEKATLLELLTVADTIESDFEKVRVLTMLAPYVDDEELEEAYLRVADEVQGEFEYGRAVKALRRGGRS